TGLANGISSAAETVVSAITGVVGGAVDAAKALLGIESPSRVFAAMGRNVGAGFEQGVDDSAPDTRTALERMVDPPDAAGGGTTNNVKRGGNNYNITIEVSGGEAMEIAQKVREELLSMFEGDLDPDPAPA